MPKGIYLRTKPSPWKGKHPTEEMLLKMRKPRSEQGKHYMKGIPKTEEHKRKMSEYRKGKHFSPATEFKKGQSSHNKGIKSDKPAWNKGVPCSDETKRKMSKSAIGKHDGVRNPMFGVFKKHSIETRKKMSKPRTETHKSNISKATKGENNPMFGRVSPMKGKKHTKEALIKMSGRTGEMSNNWKGGATPLMIQIRVTKRYLEWRSMVFERDGFTCQGCGIHGDYLESHHIKRFSEIIHENNIQSVENALVCDDLWDISNGVCLCRSCHASLDKKGGLPEKL